MKIGKCMKKILLLSLLALSSSVFAQELDKVTTYQIELSDVNKTWVKTITKTVDPKNIIAADFEDISPVASMCVDGKPQDVTEKAEGIFSTEPGSQQLTLSVTKVLNIQDFQANCSTSTPVVDIVNVRIGFPLLSFEQTVKTEKNTYLVTAKRVRQ